jgi:hypothetical protein
MHWRTRPAIATIHPNQERQNHSGGIRVAMDRDYPKASAQWLVIIGDAAANGWRVIGGMVAPFIAARNVAKESGRKTNKLH